MDVVVVMVVAVEMEMLGHRCLVMVAFARGGSKLVTCGG